MSELTILMIGMTFAMTLVLPVIFLLLAQRIFFMIAWFALFLTVSEGSWLWLCLLIMSWSAGFWQIRRELGTERIG
jgi:hypothetical protein